MMQPNKTPEVLIYCKYARKYSIFAYRPVKKETTLKDLHNDKKRNNIICLSVYGSSEHGLIVSLLKAHLNTSGAL